MTDIIVIVIAVIFVLVLLDGLRRKWKERRNRVVMKLDNRSPATAPVAEDEALLFKSELPNGGARTIHRNSHSAAVHNTSPSRSTSTKDVPVLMDAVELEEDYIEHTNVYADSSTSKSYQDAKDYDDADDYDDDEEPEEYIDGLDEEFLIDDVSPVRSLRRDKADDKDADDFADEWDDDDSDAPDEWEEDEGDCQDYADDDRDDYVDDPDEKWSRDDSDDESADELTDAGKAEVNEDTDEYEAYEEYAEYEDDFAGDESRKQYVSAGRDNDQSSAANRIEPGFGGEELQSYELDEDFDSSLTDEDERHQEVQQAKKRKSVFTAGFLSRKDQGELFRDDYSQQEAEPDTESNDAPQEVIIINVMARPGELLEGFDLLPVLQLQGLRLGDMSIFHKYAGSNGSGAVLFSMANMVKPGSFDIGSMANFSTPGISFFLQLPNKQGNMHCFDQMLAAATAVKNSLEGELKDENRSVFTRQTLEHYRQRIQDFELSMLSRK